MSRWHKIGPIFTVNRTYIKHLLHLYTHYTFLYTSHIFVHMGYILSITFALLRAGH